MKRRPRAITIGDEDPDNVDDEQEGTLSVLDDDINDSVEEELQAAFEDLGEDQLAEVIAFCWVGQGTYEASDWDEAMEEAQRLVSDGAAGRDRRADGAADARLGARIGPRRVRPQLRRDRRPHLTAAKAVDRQPSPTDRQDSGEAQARVIASGRGAKSRSSSVLQRARDLRRDLVLDRDVRAPAAAVLRAQKAVQVFSEIAPHAVEVRRDDTERHAAAEIHQPFDRCSRRRFTDKGASVDRTSLLLTAARRGTW